MTPSAIRESGLMQAKRSVAAGRLAESERHCRQLLALNPDDVDALTILLAITVKSNRIDEAAPIAERCVALDPRQPMHFVNLGKVRMMMNRPGQAVEAYDAALTLRPSLQPALAGKADALNRLGRAQEAIELLEPASRRRHDSPEMGLTLATLLAQAGRHDDAIAVSTRHLVTPAVSDVVRSSLEFVLGASLEKTGKFDEAFGAYRRANAVRGKTSRFSADQLVRHVDHLIAFFSEKRLKSLARSAEGSQRPVIVVGMPRSGTTLIEQIIAAHPQGHGAGETTALDRIWHAIPAFAGAGSPMPEALERVDASLAGKLASQYLRETASDADDRVERIVDKYLGNHMLLGLAWMLLPGARVVVTTRDPMDTCLSCYASALSPIAHGWCSDLTNLGIYHRQCRRLIEHWLAVLPMPAMTASYEELVVQPEAMTRRLIDFCGLPWDDRCLQFHESGRTVRTLSYDQVRRPVYKTSVARHKPFEAHLGDLRAALEAKT